MAAMSGVREDNEDVLPVVDRGAADDGPIGVAQEGVDRLEDSDHVDAPDGYQGSHPEQPQQLSQEQPQQLAQEKPQLQAQEQPQPQAQEQLQLQAQDQRQLQAQEQPQLQAQEQPQQQAQGQPLQLGVAESSFNGTIQALVRRSKQIPEYTSSHYQHWQTMRDDMRHGQQDSLQKVNQQGYNDRLTLHIGGTRFETSRQTLCVDADSMLAAWVLRHLNDGDTMMWLDRDGNRFGHVLNYLRNGTIFLQDVPSLRAVQEEAAFFGLSGLQALCEERIKHLEIRERDKMRKKEQYQEHVMALLRAILDREPRCPHSKAPPVVARALPKEDPIFDTNVDF